MQLCFFMDASNIKYILLCFLLSPLSLHTASCSPGMHWYCSGSPTSLHSDQWMTTSPGGQGEHLRHWFPVVLTSINQPAEHVPHSLSCVEEQGVMVVRDGPQTVHCWQLLPVSVMELNVVSGHWMQTVSEVFVQRCWTPSPSSHCQQHLFADLSK